MCFRDHVTCQLYKIIIAITPSYNICNLMHVYIFLILFTRLYEIRIFPYSSIDEAPIKFLLLKNFRQKPHQYFIVIKNCTNIDFLFLFAVNPLYASSLISVFITSQPSRHFIIKINSQLIKSLSRLIPDTNRSLGNFPNPCKKIF